MDSTLKRTWASIDLDALAYNCRHLQERMGPGARMLGVVKADAYGHGAVQSARVLEEMGCAYLAVSNIDEARELRLGGVGLPVLQLGATPADQSAAILANGVTQAGLLWHSDGRRAAHAAFFFPGGHLERRRPKVAHFAVLQSN